MLKKNKLFNYFVIVCSAILLFLIAIVLVNVEKRARANRFDFSYLSETKEVILFIGDGMGKNHVSVTEETSGERMIFSDFAIQGEVTTCSLALASPTDSAASATAMATGVKVFNGEVGMHNGAILMSITEYAKLIGKGVAIVTTDNLTGATPACFSSHALDRGNTEEIISTQLKSNVDLFLGAGSDTYKDYEDDFMNQGYEFYSSFNDIKISEKKIFGAFESVGYNEDLDIPTLKDLTIFAINYLQANYPNGYFLMCEGAHIDKMSHNNDLEEMINYLNGFNQAIVEAINLVKSKNYLIFVTADHETGDLKLPGVYNRTGHSSQNVPFYIKTNKNLIFPKKIDNTNIYGIMKGLMKNE